MTINETKSIYKPFNFYLKARVKQMRLAILTNNLVKYKTSLESIIDHDNPLIKAFLNVCYKQDNVYDQRLVYQRLFFNYLFCLREEAPFIKYAIDSKNIAIVKTLFDVFESLGYGENITRMGLNSFIFGTKLHTNILEYAIEKSNQEIVDYLRLQGAMTLEERQIYNKQKENND